MATKAEKEEARRQERLAGWRSEHFRFRENEQGALFIAQAEWIGPETLVVNGANVDELIGELKKLSSDLEDDGPEDDLSDPGAKGYDPNAVPEDPQTTKQEGEK